MSKKWKNPGKGTEYEGIYNSWNHLFQRAKNKGGKYPTYTDVTVCKEWYDYDVFFEWAVNNGWKKGLCLDKDSIIPGNREYKPEACKWVTRSENCKEMVNRLGSPMKKPEVSKKFKGDNNPMKRLDVREKFKGKNNYGAKKVQCIETGVIYDCCKDAERELELPNCSVSMSANPNCSQQTAGGYHWRYV